MRRRHRRRTLGPALLALLPCLPGPGARADGPAPAAGSAAALLEGAARAELVVAGTFSDAEELDARGRAARLSVERVLRGPAPPSALVRVAWEELAPSRPSRFAEGTRAVVALSPLPRSSLWRRRLPSGEALAVAGDGRAFLRDPAPGDLEALEAWARLEPDARRGPAGSTALARLAAQGSAGLAVAALSGLSERSQAMPEEALRALASLLTDHARPRSARAGVLALAGRRGMTDVRPEVVELAERSGPLRAEAVAALARLDGGLPAERVRQLLEAAEPALRAVAVRWAPEAGLASRARELLADDPSPEVRARAAAAWLRHRGAAGLREAEPALVDPDPSVRAAAARAAGALGEPAIAPLVALAAERDAASASGPIAALALAGPAGRAGLERLATEHGDEAVRELARFALGRAGAGH